MKKIKTSKPPYINYCDLAVYPLSIGFTSNEDKFYKELERVGIPTNDVNFLDDSAIATTHYFTSDYVNKIIIVIERNPEFKDLMVGLLIHEATHAWQYIEETIGEKNNDEIEAYTIQYISNFLIDEFKAGN